MCSDEHVQRLSKRGAVDRKNERGWGGMRRDGVAFWGTSHVRRKGGVDALYTPRRR